MIYYRAGLAPARLSSAPARPRAGHTCIYLYISTYVEYAR